MAFNGTNSLSNCTSQSASNYSENASFECTDLIFSVLLTGFSSLVNVVFILPLNCWILWLARRTTAASSDFVVLNQAVAEVIANIFIVVFVLGAIFNEKVVILISVYLCTTLIVGRPLFQTYFCVERYLAVVHPLVYLKYTKAPKFKLPFVGLIWLTLLIMGWFIMNSYPRIPRFYIGVFLVMLVVCSFCSVMILWVLKRPKPGDGEKAGAYQLKRKAFIAVTAILITLVFGYGTVSCAIVLRDQLPYSTYCLVLNFSWCTLVPSAAVQPYLYLSKIGKLPCIKS